MRALLQRVASARVVVDGAVVGEIGKGVLAFVGIDVGDGDSDQAYIVGRVLACRLFDSIDGKAWGASISTLGLPVLIVSQFTLGANCKKPKPSFHRAMPAERARVIYDNLLEAFRASHPAGSSAVAAGQFQAMMQVHLVNDGPVTVLIDSKNRDDVVPPSAVGSGAAGQATPLLDADAGDDASVIEASSPAARAASCTGASTTNIA